MAVETHLSRIWLTPLPPPDIYQPSTPEPKPSRWKDLPVTVADPQKKTNIPDKFKPKIHEN